MTFISDGCVRCVRCGLVFESREVVAEEHVHTPKGPMHFSCSHLELIAWVRGFNAQESALLVDGMVHGVGFVKDGKRIDPESVSFVEETDA